MLAIHRKCATGRMGKLSKVSKAKYFSYHQCLGCSRLQGIARHSSVDGFGLFLIKAVKTKIVVVPRL